MTRRLLRAVMRGVSGWLGMLTASAVLAAGGTAASDARWAQWAVPPIEPAQAGVPDTPADSPRGPPAASIRGRVHDAAALESMSPMAARLRAASTPTPSTTAGDMPPPATAAAPSPTPAAASAPAAVSLDGPLPSAAPASLELFLGETRVLPAPDIARIAVGNGNVLHAAAADGREVVVFARALGSTSLVIWTRDGKSRALRVDVVPGETLRIQNELTAVLARIPGVRSASVGDKLLVEGDGLSDADQARIGDLAARYPQVIDLTGAIGWDRMVLFDVQVVELPRSDMQDLGVRWDPNTLGGLNAAGVWDAGSGAAFLQRPGTAAAQAAFPLAGAAGYVGLNAALSSRLHALSRRGDAVLLAQPQLLARNGTTASFLAGGELPYTTVDKDGKTSTVFKPYGVGLDVTPRIDRSGTVRARIEVEVSAVDPAVTTSSGPGLRTRRTATEFNVASGQTLVLSGFLSREQVTDEDAVPGLSRIPLLGALFRARRVQHKDTELAIFVTPWLIGADDATLAQRVQAGRDVLDQTFPAPTRLLVPMAAPGQATPNLVGDAAPPRPSDSPWETP